MLWEKSFFRADIGKLYRDICVINGFTQLDLSLTILGEREENDQIALIPNI